MFPMTRDILIYALVFLISIMLVLIVLILRKRMSINVFSGLRKSSEKPKAIAPDEHEDVPKPEKEEKPGTGPDDAESIKEMIKSEKGEESEHRPEHMEPSKAPAYIEPPKISEPKKEDEPEKKLSEPALQEGVIEQGVELHDEEEEKMEEEKYGKPDEADESKPEEKPKEGHEKAPPVPPEPPKEEEKPIDEPKEPEEKEVPKKETIEEKPAPKEHDVEYVKLDDEKKPPAPPEPKIVKEKEVAVKTSEEKPAEKEVTKEAVREDKADKVKVIRPSGSSGRSEEFSHKKVKGIETGKPIATAEITKDPGSFIDQTVAVEGELHLSSKGEDDVWYVLFDDSGSSIVMSKEEIPLSRCRIIAKVEKTKLGQIYLNVLRYEKV